MYMSIVCKQETRDDLHELVNCESYKVILLNHSTDFNQKLIQENLANDDSGKIEFEECWDDELDSYSTSKGSDDQIFKSENKNEQLLNIDDFDTMFDDKEFFEMIGLPPTAKFVLPDKKPLIETKPKENLVSDLITVQPLEVCEQEPLDSDDDLYDDTSPPALVTATKNPKIEWLQTESLIRLKIKAIDCLDYTFEVNNETISIV